MNNRNRYYTFQTIKSNEVEKLLIELKKFLNDYSFESVQEIIDVFDGGGNQDLTVIDGGEYTSRSEDIV